MVLIIWIVCSIETDVICKRTTQSIAMILDRQKKVTYCRYTCCCDCGKRLKVDKHACLCHLNRPREEYDLPKIMYSQSIRRPSRRYNIEIIRLSIYKVKYQVINMINGLFLEFQGVNNKNIIHIGNVHKLCFSHYNTHHNTYIRRIKSSNSFTLKKNRFSLLHVTLERVTKFSCIS